MAPPLRIATPYALPFPVELHAPPLFSTGKTVEVQAELRRTPTNETSDSVQAALLPFVFLAQSGALAGEHLDPATSTIGDESGPVIEGRALRWTFGGCRLDERAAVVLTNFFLAVNARYPLARLTIRRGGDAAPAPRLLREPMRIDPYPLRWSGLPWKPVVDPNAAEARTLQVSFRTAPSSEQAEDVALELQTWIAAVAAGAYGAAPVPPQSCDILADPEPEVVDRELTWSVHKFKAHPNAFEGLINIVAAVHGDIAPVEGMRLEA